MARGHRRHRGRHFHGIDGDNILAELGEALEHDALLDHHDVLARAFLIGGAARRQGRCAEKLGAGQAQRHAPSSAFDLAALDLFEKEDAGKADRITRAWLTRVGGAIFIP